MMNDKKALLIIDMQKGSFMEAPCFDADGVIKRINLLSGIFRKLNFPVIIIQHDGTRTNDFIPNTTAWELLDELEVKPSDILISKQANDSFYDTPLQSKLKALNTNGIVITGTTTDFCIDSTVQSALSKDYNITVVKDGHTMSDRPGLKAEQLIEHYNTIWKYLIPTRGKIEVINFEEIRKEMVAVVE